MSTSELIFLIAGLCVVGSVIHRNAAPVLWMAIGLFIYALLR